MASSNSVSSVDGGASLSSTAAHQMVCDMVAAQVEAEGPSSSGWAEYGSVFLSAEVQDPARSRLGVPVGGHISIARASGGF